MPPCLALGDITPAWSEEIGLEVNQETPLFIPVFFGCSWRKLVVRWMLLLLWVWLCALVASCISRAYVVMLDDTDRGTKGAHLQVLRPK